MVIDHPLKKTGLILVGLLILVILDANTVAALDVPALKGHVSDYAGMLSPASQRQLEAVLTDFEQKESTQIAVLTIPSLKGDALEDFSMRVADAWKIGQSEADNGAILLIVKNDRKIRIEVGYGLEGRLTDLLAGRIIRNIIAPQFKMGNFDQGVSQGVAAMIGAVKGEFSATTPQKRPASQKGPPLIAIIGLIFLINVVGRTRRLFGAAAGAILFPIAGALFFGLGPMLILGLIPVGIVAGLLISLFGGPFSSGGAGSHRHGGYWGGGFGGGGGFSSGGFGGFSGGGGGFGGGGASGGW